MDEYPLLVLLALIYIMPFLIQVSTSFTTEPEAAAALMTSRSRSCSRDGS